MASRACLRLYCGRKEGMRMTSYRITLHSPMGPRRGVLHLLPGSGQARMDLLGCRSQLAAEQTAPGCCRLTGRLESVMGPIDFAAEVPAEGTFDCVARTGKGDMRLTGERMEGNEET